MNNTFYNLSYQDQLPIKRMELFVFLDPFCKDCLELDYILYRLTHEYGHYYKIRQILTFDLERLNMCFSYRQNNDKKISRCCQVNRIKSKNNLIHSENLSNEPYYATLALKSAQFQGTKAGARYLRSLINSYFLYHENISELDVLEKCAREARIDLKEFYNDLHSEAIISAIRSDFLLSKEMDITSIPSIVIFSSENEKEAIKISGIQSYETYESVITKLLGKDINKGNIPNLQTIIDDFLFFTVYELSLLTGKSTNELDIELKKLQLLQVIEKYTLPSGVYWRKKNCI